LIPQLNFCQPFPGDSSCWLLVGGWWLVVWWLVVGGWQGGVNVGARTFDRDGAKICFVPVKLNFICLFMEIQNPLTNTARTF